MVEIVFLVINGIRAFLVMAIASASAMRGLGGQDHIVFDWALILIATILLYLLAKHHADAHQEAARG